MHKLTAQSSHKTAQGLLSLSPPSVGGGECKQFGHLGQFGQGGDRG